MAEKIQGMVHDTGPDNESQRLNSELPTEYF